MVAFVFLLGYGYFYYIADFEHDLYNLFSYITAAIFVFSLIVDNIRLITKKMPTEFDYYDLEQELEHVSSASELLRHRFISTIEILNDGLSFREGEHIFGTDKYIDIMGIKDNEITFDKLLDVMHKDDLVQYKMKLSKLSKKMPTYTITYRVEVNGIYKWIREQGKLVIVDKKRTYISIVKPIDLMMFPQTDVDVLNTLESEKKMLEEMQKLSRTNKAYHLVIIQLTNIPKINEKYGRDFGDLMMGEYLSKLRFKFIKDNKSLYRISGVKFGLIIKDKNKFEVLNRALVGTGELLTLSMKFGGVSQTIYPNLGISESPYGGKNTNQVYKEASDALASTLKENSQYSFSFYSK